MTFLLRFAVHEPDCQAVLDAFAGDFANSSIFRKADSLWYYHAYCDTQPNQGLVETLYQLAMLKSGGDADNFHYHIETLPATNWLAENQKHLKPFLIDRFLIIPNDTNLHVTHRKSIKINGSLAFGTGKHATTQLCIKILAQIAKKQKAHRTPPITRILDMGCGTAILAIAAGHLFKQSQITAYDIAKDSIIISRDNARINTMKPRFTIAQKSNPYQPRSQRNSKPYQLVMANILAEPLKQMRLDFARMMPKNGLLLLSGLLHWQRPFLHHGFGQKFQLLQSHRQGDWLAMLYRKTSP
ncbi:MAG: 50S ribosomal protein L11 methyltransferase [Alphaproteobacteria bacterium]|nr:50S ribosomal protein L11 methyltransferase [Alphaproteobacteria bacterium]